MLNFNFLLIFYYSSSFQVKGHLLRGIARYSLAALDHIRCMMLHLQGVMCYIMAPAGKHHSGRRT